MVNSKFRRTNEKFFDEYRIFDEIMCERWNYDEDGVGKYLEKMKDSYIEAKDAINEWDTTYQRLTAIKKRFDDLDNNETSFDDFQGKDEDVVWMQVFCEKLDANADPLSKYKTLKFTYKKRPKSLWQKIKDMFG